MQKADTGDSHHSVTPVCRSYPSLSSLLMDADLFEANAYSVRLCMCQNNAPLMRNCFSRRLLKRLGLYRKTTGGCRSLMPRAPHRPILRKRSERRLVRVAFCLCLPLCHAKRQTEETHKSQWSEGNVNYPPQRPPNSGTPTPIQRFYILFFHRILDASSHGISRIPKIPAELRY